MKAPLSQAREVYRRDGVKESFYVSGKDFLNKDCCFQGKSRVPDGELRVPVGQGVGPQQGPGPSMKHLGTSSLLNNR